MGCLGCSCSTDKDNAPGCRSNGGCGSGGCNRHNTYDWISALGIGDAHTFDVVEVSFKNGSHKEFYNNPPHTRVVTGDQVLVECGNGGFDIGQVSLSGELVRLQMKRKKVRSDARLLTVIRKAHERDLERLDEVRRQERDIMIRARAVARSLGLNMKIGDVEFQGDGRKCTFYYTADGRVDFRELIRHYAREFKVKIEMRQIGARQESARIGGLGNCGRELCCSTWLTEFKSVNTAAARYQNLAINQTKLSGMCGRLKCCLNYELDTYVEALEEFPDKAEKLRTTQGLAILVKTDVFKRLMYYTYVDNRGKLFTLHVDQVWEVLDLIKKGQLPTSLEDIQAMAPPSEEPEEVEPDYESVDNVIELPFEKRTKRRKKKKKNRSGATAAQAVENAADKPSRNDQRNRQPDQQRRSDGQGKPKDQGQRPRPPRPQPGDKPQAKDAGQQRPPLDAAPPKDVQAGGGSPKNNNRRRDKRRKKPGSNRPPDKQE
ncbi:MAG: regulatory iron-sulfur-containing complex subunit RicT [Saprospiraceae bacterium]|nr:regulatory iron-sulfur-containing complex subunit RicT [Saprospiraceae bacterium]